MWCDRFVSAVCGILRASSAIRRSFVETASELGVPVILPSNGSSYRRPLRSAGSLGSVSLLPRYYGALRLLAVRLAALRLLFGRDTSLHSFVRSHANRVRSACAWRLVHPGFHVAGTLRWRRRGLPGPCVTPMHARPGLRPRWDDVSRLDDTHVLPRLPKLAWLPRVCGLSGLDSTALVLAVYASRCGSPLPPRKTRFRLVADR
jgi:hypothetical protein